MYAAFWGSVTYVDHLVGRLATALHETGELERSLIIYTSDHGEMLGSHGVFGQFGVLFEDVARVPFIVRVPGGANGGRRCDQLVSHVDLVPTILGWAGGPQPAESHGHDAGTLIAGGDNPIHHGVASEYHSPNWADPVLPMRAWITTDAKLVVTQDGTDELYDLRRDPHETRTLIDDPSAGDQLAQLRADLRGWQRETDDRWPVVPRADPDNQP